ncbi:unnamed protein product, partial [Amoebophrya sp. A120]
GREGQRVASCGSPELQVQTVKPPSHHGSPSSASAGDFSFTDDGICNASGSSTPVSNTAVCGESKNSENFYRASDSAVIEEGLQQPS